MKTKRVIDYAMGLENIVIIGEEITRELECVTSLMRENIDDVEMFLENKNYTCNTLNDSILDYILNKVNKSELYIMTFEKELESVSNYSREDEILEFDSKFLSSLKNIKDINLFLRLKIEEFIVNLEVIKTLVEDITLNLNDQRTESLLGSRYVM